MVFCSGSRDGCLGVWNTEHTEAQFQKKSAVCVKEPLSWLKSIHSDEKVRAIQYNSISMVSFAETLYLLIRNKV